MPPIRADRLSIPWPGSASPAPTALPASAIPRMVRRLRPAISPRSNSRRSFWNSGANPNVRIDWEDKKFDKEGGTMRNPPLIQLGRHYLTYIGATPFYIAAHNGDVAYMRLLAQHGADPNITNALDITPLIAASGLDYWEGEAPGPFTGVSEAERIEAVKLAIELGNDINAHADFGDYKMEGDPQYLLLYYPLNKDELSQSPGRSSMERQHRAACGRGLRPAGHREVPDREAAPTSMRRPNSAGLR